MRLLRMLALTALVLGAFGGSALAGGEASLFVGQKQLDSDDFDPVDDQTEIGVATSWDLGWPVALAVDILQSSDDDSLSEAGYSYEIDVESTELNVGVRKFWGEKIRPYVGGGVAWIQLDGRLTITSFGGGGSRGGIPLPFDVVNDDDSDIGYFANAGVAFRLGSRFQLAVDVRYSDAEATVPVNDPFMGGSAGEVEFESGGTHYGLLLGAHW